MRVLFDPSKDTINKRKRKLSLAFAEELDWNAAYTYEDNRFFYGEKRMIGLVPKGDFLYYVVYVEIEDEIIKVISLRFATNNERDDYVNSFVP
jgi:uncharacterized DUF497 family protein